VHSHLFVACLKAFFLALSSLWELASSPLSSRFKFIKKCYFQPLFCRFVKTKKLALFAASLPLQPKRNWSFSTAFLPLWKEKTINFCLFIACLKISIVLGKLKAP